MMVTSWSFIHIISKYPGFRHSRSSLLNTCCLLPKIPFQCLLHNLLHCSGIHLCKILLIQFHRQFHRHTLQLLLFFTRQNTLNRLFRNLLSHLPQFHCLLRFQFLSLSLCHLLDHLLHLHIQIRQIHSGYHCQCSLIHCILKLRNQPVQPHVSGNIPSSHSIFLTKLITAFL